ncbi:MAG: alpha/beta fold hydrolase [Rhodospirillales bacterium]
MTRTTTSRTAPDPGLQGPRPLPLHLALQTMTWLGSLAALSGLKNGSLAWRPAQREAADALRRSLADADPDPVALAAAVDAEARGRLEAFMAGVARYRCHPRRPRPPEPPVLWRRGTTRALDYGLGAEDAPPVLVVPSLVNRGYILDLTENRSLMRHLAAAGLRPILVDWGAPGARERGFGLTDYIRRRLEPLADEIHATTGRAPHVVGYCMGGLLALALAQRRPERVARLALLATPWDFHAGSAATIRMLAATAPGLLALVEQWGELPVDVVQSMFAGLDPFSTAEKFRRFAALEAGSAKAREFVALEDWLNDGVPLPGPVARECLFGWYVENAPAKGAWRIDGRCIAAGDVRAPTLVLIPGKDHIVPPGSAAALADALPGATAKTVAAGHIGMVAGSRARTMLFKPLGEWLTAA